MNEEELNQFLEAIYRQYFLTEQQSSGEDMPPQVAGAALNAGGADNNIGLTFQRGRPGIEVAVGDNQVRANVGLSGLTPSAVGAGISGNMGDLDINIPLDDPKRLTVSGKTEVANNILSGGWSPMAKALFLNLEREF